MTVSPASSSRLFRLLTVRTSDFDSFTPPKVQPGKRGEDNSQYKKYVPETTRKMLLTPIGASMLDARSEALLSVV
jgi:hypothetical protein